MAVAGGLRAVAPVFPMLVLFTAIFGIGIGIAQPGLPRLGLALAPRNAGLATGVYSGGFFAGSVMAALATPFLLDLVDGSGRWRFPLAVWGILAVASWVVWFVGARFWSTSEPHSRSAAGEEAKPVHWSPWLDRKAWIVTLLFSGQGLAYYLLLAWLPSIYEDDGLHGRVPVLLFALYNLSTLPGMVGIPLLSDRIGSRRIPTLIATCSFLIGAAGLALFATTPYLLWIWPVLSAFGVAGLFGMGMLMPVDVAPAGKTGAAAGMVLFVGYLASAAGPLVGGVIKDATGSFERALLILPLMALGLIVLAFFTPRPFESRTTP